MSKIKLTETQRQVLAHAADDPSGALIWFPEKVKGGACQAVIDGLAKKALICRKGSQWHLAAAGYEALGRTKPGDDAEGDQAKVEKVPRAKAGGKAQSGDKAGGSRTDTKQATVIQMLRSAEGATVAQLSAATGWSAHTIHGVLSGTIRKRLGLALTSAKTEGSERTYRII